MKLNLPNYWNKSGKVKLAEKIYKKLKEHNDENFAKKSEKELKKHFKKGEPTWEQMKKVLKKRFPYLTDKELDFIHDFGDMIEKCNLTESNWRYKLI